MTGDLKSSLRPVHLAAIGMGTTIGVGWVVVTGGWVVQAGPVGASIAFLIGGLVMALVAVCYTDLAIWLPKARGEFGYVSTVFGPPWGFAVGWAVLLGYIAICCFEGLAMAWLIGFLAPGITGPVLYNSLGTPVRALDIALVTSGAFLFTLVNYIGARESARVQVVVTLGKVLLSLGFVLIGLLGGDRANLSPPFAPEQAPWQGVMGVLILVPAWFCGFNALPQALPEAKEKPRARVLGALMGSVIGMTTLFYIAVILATATATPRGVLATSDLPVVAAIDTVVGLWGGRIVLITGVIALLSAWNAAMFASSRLIHGLASAGALPRFLASVHPVHGTPANALIFVGLVTFLGAMMGRAFIEPLLQMGAIGFLIAFIAVTVCCFGKRPEGEPQRDWKVRVTGLVTAPLLTVVLCLSLFSLFDHGRSAPAEAVALLGWVCVGAILHRMAARSRRAMETEQAS